MGSTEPGFVYSAAAEVTLLAYSSGVVLTEAKTFDNTQSSNMESCRRKSFSHSCFFFLLQGKFLRKMLSI